MYLYKGVQLVLFCLLSLTTFSQNSVQSKQVTYIRIQLNDLTTWEEVSTIDAFIRSKEGVLVTRTDRYSDTFFAQYTGSSLTETDFVTWIESLGFTTKCVVTGLSGEPLKSFPKECNTNQNELEQRTN